MIVALLVFICILAGLIWFTTKMDGNIESAFTPAGKLTPVSGGIIHWQKQGSGPSLLLIHGLLGNSNNFNELAKTLADRYTVYSIDRPGSGFSSRYKGTSASFAQQSKMILEWMDKEGIECVSVAGHSMGGGVALRMAIDAPSKITSVSLLCPLTTPLKGGAGPLSVLYIPNEFVRSSVAKTIASPLRARLGRKQVAQIFHPESVPASFSVEGEIRCPVGVLYGEKDTILKPNEHINAVTDAIDAAEYQILPNAGHMIPVTQVQACADFICAIDAKAR